MKNNSKATGLGIRKVGTGELTSGNSYVVAADIGGTNLRLALADMTGSITARWAASTAESRGADTIINLMRGGIDDLLRQSGVPRSAVCAVAAGVPGITDVNTGTVIATSYLLGWRDVPLQSQLESALNLPAAVDNDVNLAALGESHAGVAKGVSDFVFLAIGTGIGAGIVLGGQLFRGMGWSAGEIGYMLVPGVPDCPSDRGKPGALESMIGGEGIKAEWQRRWNQNQTLLRKDLTATEIFDGAVQGDPQARTVLEQSARILAFAIYNTSLILNCPLFVLGGSVGLQPALGNATRQVLEQWSGRGQLRLVPSLLGVDAQLIGAIHLAIATTKSRQII